jgi:hypothetical protein
MFPLKESGATIIFTLLLYVRKNNVSSSCKIRDLYIIAKFASFKFSFWVYFVLFVLINFTLNEEEK